MKNSTFTTIQLSNNVRCDMLYIKAGHLMRANFDMMEASSKGELKTDVAPYLIRQIVLFNNTKPTIEAIENISFEDYIKLTDAIQAQSNKINDLYK